MDITLKPAPDIFIRERPQMTSDDFDDFRPPFLPGPTIFNL